MLFVRFLLALWTALLIIVAVAAGIVFCVITVAWYLASMLLALVFNPVLGLASRAEDLRQSLRRRT